MITLFRPGRLGDVVLLGSVTASVGACRVATEARYHPIAARLRGVVEVIEPHEAHSDGLIDLQGSLRSRLRFPLARRIRKRSVNRRLGLWTGGYLRPSVPELYGEAVGVAPSEGPWLELPEQRRDTLVLVPGAAFLAKRPTRTALLAAGRAWDGPVVVLGGPGEEALCDQVARPLKARVVCESGFRTTFDVLGRTSVAVAGDTGLLHLAAAAGAKVVGLFGPTHPDDGFFPHGGVVVSRELPCRPCSLHRVARCSRGDHACLNGLEDQVRRAVVAVS